MEENFLLTMLFFFASLLASGLLAVVINRKANKRFSIISAVISITCGIALIMPAYKKGGINQILLFSLIVFLINLSIMLILTLHKK